jgi:hypothetical protein
MVGDPLRMEKARQPETCTPGFIATHHWRGCGQTKAAFGGGHCLEQARLGRRYDITLAGLLTMARGATALPGVLTQLAGHQHTARSGALWSAWACSSMVRRFPGMEKQLTNSGPFRKSTDKHSISRFNAWRRQESD